MTDDESWATVPCCYCYSKCNAKAQEYLKVPKREIFVTELFTRSDPIWIGDMRTEPIKPFV